MMKHFWAFAEVPNDGENIISFIVELKDGCRFRLNGFYFTLFKSKYDEFHNSDYFRVDFVSEKDNKYVENAMKRAIDMLVYLIGVPYEIDYLREDTDTNIQPIDVSISKKKIEMIESFDFQYGKVKKKKDILENVLRLYSLASKYMLVLNDSEEAYFSMFRIIEKIAKDEFGIDEEGISNGYADVRHMIEKIVYDVYKIKFSQNKLNDLAGNFSASLKEKVFDDIYSKIAWFCEKKTIPYDENVLAKSVKLRNKIAHGENVIVDIDCDEYNLVVRLSNAFIYEKFFDKIKNFRLNAKIVM